jgi:hypothetical protein
MERYLLQASVTVCLLIGLVIAVNAVRDPFAAARASLDQRLAETGPEPISFDAEPDWSYDEVVRQVTGRQALWQGLTPPPQAPPSGPDLERELEDVTISQQLGKGESVKVRIRTKDDPRGKFLGKGDQLRGATIREITPTSVVFYKNYDGKEYTVVKPRGR